MIFVDETESVIVERFGNIVQVYDRDADRGAHFKLPWPIDLARRFDRRVQLFDPPRPARCLRATRRTSRSTSTSVGKSPSRRTDSTPLLERPVVRFYRGLGSVDLAEARLDSRVRSILTTAIGQVELSRLLGCQELRTRPARRRGRAARTDFPRRSATRRCDRGSEAESLRDRLGIEIVDLRITRLNLPTGNQQAVFERMKSERKKIADRYRSAGMAENQMIRSQADRQYNEILAKTRADAERIRGTAEAEAVRVLNAAHSQDPEFYTSADHTRRLPQNPQRKDDARPLRVEQSAEDVDRRRARAESARPVVPPGRPSPPSNGSQRPEATTKAKQAVLRPRISEHSGRQAVKRIALFLLEPVRPLSGRAASMSCAETKRRPCAALAEPCATPDGALRLEAGGLHYALPWPFSQIGRVNLNEDPHALGRRDGDGRRRGRRIPALARDGQSVAVPHRRPEHPASADQRAVSRVGAGGRRFSCSARLAPEKQLERIVASVATGLISQSGVDFVQPLGQVELNGLLTAGVRRLVEPSDSVSKSTTWRSTPSIRPFWSRPTFST